MLKLVILAVLVAVVNSKGLGFGYGHGGYGGYGAGPYYLGYGFVAGGHYGNYHRPGIAKVQVHQTPYNYNYAVNEHGPGYNKYIHQGASFHHGGYGAY